MTVKFNTSRDRFDEHRRFSGVYQRMGQVAVDADWNEEVRLRTVDARRRTADVADGSADDGFRICADFVLDSIRSTDGWVATDVPPGDERKPVPELRLDRHDPETLPWVIRSRWHPELRRILPAPIDLTAIPRASSTAFAAAALIFELRLDRPPADDEVVDIQVFVADSDGNQAVVEAAGHGLQTSGWCEIVVAAGELTGVDRTRVRSWGVRGLPPVARTWVGALRAVDAGLGNDVVIRGGDGTLAGAGRILVHGHRVFLESDLRFSSQPDFPDAPTLPALPADNSQHHFFFLDVWEQTVTALEDPFLLEPALDGVDTAARLRVVAQVRALPLVTVDEEGLPGATGGGTLSTNIPAGALPDRDAPEPFDPCRDRCLFTENASSGDGYIGSDNLHVRVQVMKVGGLDVALWSRDNSSTVMALTQATAVDSTTVRVSTADAARLRAGDMIVIEDRETRLRWDAPNPPVLRRLSGVQADTGILELDEPGATLTADPVPLVVGGPVGRVFSPDDGASVRRWDGADLLVTGVRYRLSDGITFAFSGDGWRSDDYWTFRASVNAPDGAAVGSVDTLTNSPAHGPVHHYAPLARATGQPRVIEDLRPRYLPLVEVRDRLKELGDRKYGPGIFVVVVGDGLRTFGDVDQSLVDGLTGDEALQAALGLLGAQGGSIFIRSGQYQLEHPVLVRGMSSVRILGDGDATVLDVRGGGGAFYVDGCGGAGAVAIEDLRLIEDPSAVVDIGEPGTDIDQPAFRIRTLFDKLIDARFSATDMPAERALGLDDIHIAGGVPNFLASVGARLREIGPGEGRAAGAVVSTIIALRRLQRQNPSTTLENLPEAQPLLGALSALPHGVVTIADSRQVAVRGCRIEALRPGVGSVGVMVTGTCGAIEIAGNRVSSATGVAALPYAPYMANTFLVAFPRAGLSLDGLSVTDNDLQATDAATTGVHVTDGVLSGLAIERNLVSGFTVGLLIEDQAEAGRDAASDRIAVRDNRIVGATAVGVQVTGDGVDVVGNEIQNSSGASPFQAGVQLTGHSSRVLDCWIEIPPAAALGPLALLAGIVVGEGIDDGSTPSRPVYDVEIAGNRIEGSGADTSAIGVVVGGSQAIYDVRVRDNVIRNLGDAALRTWSGSAPVGRLQVENNRIERVALGDLAVAADNGPTLDRLQPGIAATLAAGAANQPRSLLAALVDSALPSVRGPLDAALRWIERLSLRGAIVLAGGEGCVLRGNRISEIGRDGSFAAPTVDGAEIRTAAIAVVDTAEVVVEDNEIEAVRAPYSRLDGPGGQGAVPRPEMLDVLSALGFGPATTRIDRSEVHLAAADLRARVLDYAGAPADRRGRLSATLFGPLDALVGELGSLGGAAGALADALGRQSAQLRSATTTVEHTATANALRATLSQATSATAPDDDTQDAWDATAQLDLAITRDAATIAAAATRLLQRSDSLMLGAPAQLRASLLASLRKLIGKPAGMAEALAAAGVLGQVAAFRDQKASKKDLPTTTDLVGSTRAIVATFADAAIRKVTALGKGGDTNADRIDEIRKAKDTLIEQLSAVSGDLAQNLAADFSDVERTGGRSKPAVERLRATLTQIQGLTAVTVADRAAVAAAAPVAEDPARAAVAGRAATIQIYSKSLDRQIAGLATESDESAQNSLTSFYGLMNQLGALVADQPDIHDLANQATAAVRAAADATVRPAQLTVARSLLERIRGKLVDVLPPPAVADPVVTEPVDRRLAALGALAFECDGVDPAQLGTALDAYSAHLDRVLDLVNADAAERQRAHDTESAARNSLGSAPGPIRSGAVHSLVALVDDAAGEALAARQDEPRVVAAAALLDAAALAADPAEDAGTRLIRVKAFLAERTAKVSAALVAQIQQVGDINGLVALLHDALARMARGGGVTAIDGRPPAFAVSPAPADGVFAAGVERRARIAGNLVTEAISGVVVLGAAGHVIADPPDDGMVLEVGDNRLSGCTAMGIALRPDGTNSLVVWGNHILGCAGIAVATGDPWGQAVVVIAGSGDLVVRDNVMSDNGTTTLRALLHELAIDWRGPAGLRGNTIRHLGGGAGGAGMLITAEPIDAALIAQLAQTPFLGVEPAPRPIAGGRVPLRPDTLLSVREVAPLSPLAQEDDVIALGGLRQTIATQPILQRTLTLPATDPPTPSVAQQIASRYLGRNRVFVQHPMIDFLQRPPIVFVPPPLPRATSSVQVEGNDVDAAGPALLLLAEGNRLIAVNVGGNILSSRGRTGAAYLRRTDSTLFAGNRCECLSVVNVVVLRAGKAPVSATGNIIVGSEPVHQIVVPPVAKAPTGTVQLSVGVGGSTLNVPIDARKLMGSLDRRKNVASDTFASLLADMSAPSSTTLNQSTQAALAANLPAGVDVTVGARTLYGHTAGDETDPVTALKKLVDQVALQVDDASAAKVQVGAILTAASGDPLTALKLLDQNVLGLDTSKPTIADSLDNVSLIHEVLGDVLAADGAGAAQIAPVPAPAPPPNPAEYSLVVIGGTRVAVVGNATTAGVLVQEADTHVELNP